MTLPRLPLVMLVATVAFLGTLAGFVIARAQAPQPAPPPSHGAMPRPEEWDPQFRDFHHGRFGIMPLQEAAQIVSQRFRGRLIAARLVLPRPDERARGVALVHHLRLLTPARAVLDIRLDARTGAFLEVAGTGLTEARRKGDRR